LPDGSDKTIVKAVVDAKVAQLLQPGTAGRFYVYNAVDHRGIHGVRDELGHAAFGYPRNNEKAMLVVAILGAVITVLLLAIDMFSGWAILCLAIGLPFYFIYRSTRIEAERQFQADGNSIPAAGVGAAAG
jgi:hypothetical protein